MNAKELREALERAEWWEPLNHQYRLIEQAAKRYLPILEADPELVERIAEVVYMCDPIYKPPTWADCTADMKTWYRSTARKILAALITTDGEG